MIERLTGTVIERRPPFLVLDVNGVGYGVRMPMTSFNHLSKDGMVTVLTHTVIRDDTWQIFGFMEASERELFRELIKIGGIGPRIALAILSSMSGDAFAVCVADRAADRLTRVPGIGKKTADRVILEMSGKIDAVVAPGDGERAVSAPNVYDEAVAALIALGYKAGDARRMVEKVNADAEAEAEDIIRAALKTGVR